MPLWHTRDHGNATPCFEEIAKSRSDAGLEEPRTSAKDGGQITLDHRYKPTAYVGLRTRPSNHPAGKPWYCQWDKQRSRGKAPEYFPDCDALTQYLKREGYI